MFHFYLTLAYIVPQIYVFFRIKHLFISRGYKLWYTLIYLLLASVYPLAENVFEHREIFPAQFFTAAGGYLLPFFLYIFLSVLLFDLFLLLNMFFGIVSKALRKSFSFRFYTLSFIIFLSVATVVGGAINLNTMRISRYRVAIPKKSSQITHLRVVFVADFHIQQSTNPHYVERFVRKVNALKPDIMLYGGDIVEGDAENETSDAIESALRKIQTTYGAYGVLGNHEFYGRQEKGTFFDKAQIFLLRDTVLKIGDAFYLAGRYDQHFRQRKSVSEILQNRPLDLPVILLDHRPTRFAEVSQTPVDVQFSGHTHNGQLFPINYIIHRMYELSWGYKKINNTHFFVTSGLRLWGPPVKTAGKSEIMLVDFQFE